MTRPNAERFPMLLWGDLVKGSKPVLRRALAGDEAHECMYAWVYLTDYLAVCRVRDLLPDLNDDQRRRFFPILDGEIWNEIDRARVDPRFQISSSAFEMVALAAALAATGHDKSPSLVELGSTFFASKTKYEIVDAVAGACVPNWPGMSVDWIGIDNSSFVQDVTRLLHGRDGVRLVSDVADFSENETGDSASVLFSRFVASYVFPGGRAFAEYAAKRFDAVVIEDAFSTTDQDIEVQNHGQHETFYSLSETVAAFQAAGFQFFLLDSYPDYPSETVPCHVVKYAAVNSRFDVAGAFDHMKALGFQIDVNPVTDPSRVTGDLNEQISQDDWAQIKEAKAVSPVWGRTELGQKSNKPKSDSWWSRLKRRKPKFSLEAEGWAQYGMQGQMARDVIAQALDREGKIRK